MFWRRHRRRERATCDRTCSMASATSGRSLQAESQPRAAMEGNDPVSATVTRSSARSERGRGPDSDAAALERVLNVPRWTPYCRPRPFSRDGSDSPGCHRAPAAPRTQGQPASAGLPIGLGRPSCRAGNGTARAATRRTGWPVAAPCLTGHRGPVRRSRSSTPERRARNAVPGASSTIESSAHGGFLQAVRAG